jgi:FkbM family methyltransferase
MSYTFESYLNTPLVFEKELFSCFDQTSKISIFDIGACEGEDSIKYARMFPNAKVFAFEPLSTNFEKIINNISKYACSNIFAQQVALSSKVGETKFYVSSGRPNGVDATEDWDFGNKSSSLLPPDKVTEYHKWLAFNQEITVKTDTLRNFCDVNGIDTIDFIHLDVQGAELLVLEGAQEYLAKVKVIWLEVEAVSLYQDQPLKKDIEEFMDKRNFVKIYDQVGDIAGDQLYISAELYAKKQKGQLLNRAKNVIKHKIAQVPIVKKVLYWKHLAHEYEEMQKVSSYYRQSFSQCGEDMIVRHIFANLGITKPSYLDVGAHHPYYLSNTALFYQDGSRGINIEPDPTLFKEFLRHRKGDINLNFGVSDMAGVADFYVISPPTLNTFSKEEAEKYSQIEGFFIRSIEKIPVKTLANILGEYCNGSFPQFLSIDAEGIDELIIKNIDYEQNSPIVICIETISFSTTGLGVKNAEIIDFLISRGYLAYADTNINTIFVKKELWERAR